MGMLHNETYLWPAKRDTRLDARRLSALVAALVAARVVKRPFTAVTGARLELPFCVYSDLGDVLLDGEEPPPGMSVLYRGDDVERLLESFARRDGDLVVCFADLPSLFDSERPHPVLLYALAEPRDIELHQGQFDEDFREIPGTEIARYRVGSAVVVHGHGWDNESPRYHPLGDIATVLEQHVGAVEKQWDILH